MKRRTTYTPRPEKFCERCNTPLLARIYSSGEEELSAFMKRKYCSLACSNTRGKKGQSRTQMMVQARAAALKPTCECCGGIEKLAIHHVNENWKDNSLENLQTLCVYCHQQWHGLHRRLGITASTRMPPLASLLSHPDVKVMHKVHWGSFDPRTEWDACAPTATQSCLKPSQSSSAPVTEALCD